MQIESKGGSKTFCRMSWLLAIYVLLLFPQAPAAKETEGEGQEEPGVIIAEEGEPVNITCKFHHQINRALRLNRTLRKPMEVLYIAVWEKRKNEAPEYANRTEYFELNNTITIMLQRMKSDDSDVYMCQGLVLKEGEPMEIDSRSTMLAVKAASDNKSRNNSSYLWMLCALIVQSVLLVAVLAFCILFPENNKINCKKNKERGAQNMIYEDMTCSLRHHTQSGTNTYYT